MRDQDVLDEINRLTREEEEIHESTGHGEGLTPSHHDRLQAIEVELDRCWDLLRQRRAARRAGRDADEASPRDAGTVETYLQ